MTVDSMMFTEDKKDSTGLGDPFFSPLISRDLCYSEPELWPWRLVMQRNQAGLDKRKQALPGMPPRTLRVGGFLYNAP